MREGLLIIAPLADPIVRTRLFKMARVADEIDLSVGFWGWKRYLPKKTSEAEPSVKLVEHQMLLSLNVTGRWSRPLYPVWALVVFIALIFRTRPKRVYCLGLETAASAWLASFFRRVEYIFDDADRFVMVQPLPRFLHYIVTRIERRVSANSLVHIIPGRDRYDYENSKMKVVRNTPTLEDVGQAMKNPLPDKPAPFVVYANGWLGETRGLPVVYELARHFAEDKRIHFILAGRLEGPAAEEITSLPNVTYYGSVSTDMALAYGRIADVLLTLYDPAIEINRYAESNKWGDAIFIGLPVLVNDEVITSRFLQEAKVAFTFPYPDTEAAIQLVSHLADNPQECVDAKERMKNVGKDMLHFDDQLKSILTLLK